MTLPATLQDCVLLDRLTEPKQNLPNGLRSENGRKYSNYKTCLFDCRIYLSSGVSETENLLFSEISGRVKIFVLWLGKAGFRFWG